MNEPPSPAGPPADLSPDDVLAAQFAGLVLQQTSLARMLLGQTPHPQSGESALDIDGARMVIDQLEMLEVKTKGNLSEAESRLLKQSLTGLRLAFVQAVERQPAGGQPAAPAPEAGAAKPAATESTDAEASAEADARKKFTKKY